MSVGILRDLPLPDNARLDLAYQHVSTFPTPPPSVEMTVNVGGQWFVIPLFFQFQFGTIATVINRVVKLQVQNADGTDFMTIPAAASQPENQTWNYHFSGTSSASYLPAGVSESYAPLPPLILEPGMKMITRISSLQVGDMVSNLRLLEIRIPTGPAIDAGVPPIVHPVAIPVTGLAA